MQTTMQTTPAAAIQASARGGTPVSARTWRLGTILRGCFIAVTVVVTVVAIGFPFTRYFQQSEQSDIFKFASAMGIISTYVCIGILLSFAMRLPAERPGLIIATSLLALGKALVVPFYQHGARESFLLPGLAGFLLIAAALLLRLDFHQHCLQAGDESKMRARVPATLMATVLVFLVFSDLVPGVVSKAAGVELPDNHVQLTKTVMIDTVGYIYLYHAFFYFVRRGKPMPVILAWIFCTYVVAELAYCTWAWTPLNRPLPGGIPRAMPYTFILLFAVLKLVQSSAYMWYIQDSLEPLPLGYGGWVSLLRRSLHLDRPPECT